MNIKINIKSQMVTFEHQNQKLDFHFWTSKSKSIVEWVTFERQNQYQNQNYWKKSKVFQNQCQNQSLVINARTTSHIFWFDGRRHDWLGPLGLTFIHYFIMLNMHISCMRKMGVLFMGVFFPGVLQRYFFWGCFSRGIYSKVFILGVFFPLTGSMCSGPSSSKHDQ